MKKKDKNYSSWLLCAGLVSIAVLVAVLLPILLNGNTTIVGGFDTSKTLDTLVCSSEVTAYPIFDFDYSASKSLRINIVFDEDSIDSISLMYKLNYADAETMTKSGAHNHAAMNLSFYDVGMKTDDLNAKYSFVDNSFQMSIYAKKNELTQKSLKYFLLDDLYDITILDKDTIANTYNNKGLGCVVKNEKEVDEK